MGGAIDTSMIQRPDGPFRAPPTGSKRVSAGAIYHVMNRGDRRERIFMDDADRQRFVETLGEACAKTGWQVHAYVLMPNHLDRKSVV